MPQCSLSLEIRTLLHLLCLPLEDRGNISNGRGAEHSVSVAVHLRIAYMSRLRRRMPVGLIFEAVNQLVGRDRS